VGFLLALPGAILAVFALYLLTLAVAARARPAPAARRTAGPHTRLVVLVPAHDEEALVARCVRSLRRQAYPAELYRIAVIADNCTDATAAAATSAGAEVMVRTAPDLRGKGHALRWAMDGLLGGAAPPDAIAVVDADSVAEEDLLARLVAELEAGHDVVQADYTLLEDGGPRTGEMARIGFLLFHRVRFSGRLRLGLAANLVGNGMLFSRHVLETHPWDAFTAAEDLEYSIRLRLARIEPRFAPDARVAGPGPGSKAGARSQRMRWEGGRFHVVRARLARLVGAAVARRDARLLDAALDLATPPLGLLCLSVGAGATAVAAAVVIGAAPAWALVPWAAAGAAIPAFVVIGLWAAGEPRLALRAFLHAPGFLGWKLATYARLARGYDVRRWDRTDRVVP
jgi:1,2-diacylglycerol 3-beta-glucosyltransferase